MKQTKTIGANTMQVKQQPINTIEWVNVERLKANNYNPNHVLSMEMDLIRTSILKNGWLQPIVINKDYIIIDGYHRATLMKQDPAIYGLTGGLIPCVKLDLNVTDMKFLTIRINRAKGTHTAYKMHEVIKELHKDYNIPVNVIAKEIGANREEIELLIHDNIFQKEHFNEDSKYSQAWEPK